MLPKKTNRLWGEGKPSALATACHKLCKAVPASVASVWRRSAPGARVQGITRAHVHNSTHARVFTSWRSSACGGSETACPMLRRGAAERSYPPPARSIEAASIPPGQSSRRCAWRLVGRGEHAARPPAQAAWRQVSVRHWQTCWFCCSWHPHVCTHERVQAFNLSRCLALGLDFLSRPAGDQGTREGNPVAELDGADFGTELGNRFRCFGCFASRGRHRIQDDHDRRRCRADKLKGVRQCLDVEGWRAGTGSAPSLLPWRPPTPRRPHAERCR